MSPLLRDLLLLEGRDLRSLSLYERPAVLATLPLQPPLLRMTPRRGPRLAAHPP